MVIEFYFINVLKIICLENPKGKMYKAIAIIILCLFSFQVSAMDNRWFIIDSGYDLIWLTRPDQLDIDGDGINEFVDLDSKWSSNYIIGKNIFFDSDSSLVDWNGDAMINEDDESGLASIGTELNPFTGCFDGNYHTINNIYKTGVNDRNGLFEVINGARIENLRLENLKFYSDSRYNGGIVGRADQVLAAGDSNIIRRCLVSGIFVLTKIDNNLYTGGIIGRSNNTHIIECASFLEMYAVGDSLDNRRVGGIAGQLQGHASISNCYSISTVSAYEQSGLLLARSYDDANIHIRNSYAAGTIRATTDTARSTLGVFAGLIASPSIVSCYFDSSISDFPGVGESEVPVDVKGLSTSQFSDPLNFFGWDFIETWHVKEIDGILRPRLKWEDMLDLPLKKTDYPGNTNFLAPVLQWERTKIPTIIPEKPVREMLVFPNPAAEYILIKTEVFTSEYEIFNLMGRKVMSGILLSESTYLNISMLHAGMYILKIGKQAEVIIVY